MVQNNKARTVTNRGIRSKLREYFERRPGEQLFLPDIAKDLQVPESAIQNGIPNMIRDLSDYPLEVNIPARAWTYRPTGKPAIATSKRVFEEIGPAKGGIVIQDDAGNLYLAREL